MHFFQRYKTFSIACVFSSGSVVRWQAPDLLFHSADQKWAALLQTSDKDISQWQRTGEWGECSIAKIANDFRVDYYDSCPHHLQWLTMALRNDCRSFPRKSRIKTPIQSEKVNAFSSRRETSSSCQSLGLLLGRDRRETSSHPSSPSGRKDSPHLLRTCQTADFSGKPPSEAVWIHLAGTLLSPIDLCV